MEVNAYMNKSVSYNNVTDSLSVGGTSLDYGWYREYWWPYWDEHHHHYHYSYPVYPTYIKSGDKFKKAFSIAKLLLKKELLVSKKLKDFIPLVEEIAKEL